jgi:hypothetical protein
VNASDPVTAILARLSERGVAAEVLSHEPVFTMADVRSRLSFPATAQVKSLAVIDKDGSGAWR